MSTGMTCHDGCPAAGRERSCKSRFGAQRGKVAAHALAVARHKEIIAGREQMLGIAPRRADQRDAAGKRLEDADRWYPRQRRRIGKARNMDSHPRRRKGLRRPEIWQVTGVIDTGGGERGLPLWRIAYAVHPRRQ